MQIKVVKTDSSREDYLHTKVIGTFNNALALTGLPDIAVAEELAEAVTYFLYHSEKRRTVMSSDIFSMIKTVLTDTGYADACSALSRYHIERKLKRWRTEVISIDVGQYEDAELLHHCKESAQRSQWDKSKMVAKLLNTHDIDRQTARAIASLVEEKIFDMNTTSIPGSLVKQLMLSQAGAIIHAQRQLQAV